MEDSRPASAATQRLTIPTSRAHPALVLDRAADPDRVEADVVPPVQAAVCPVSAVEERVVPVGVAPGRAAPEDQDLECQAPR